MFVSHEPGKERFNVLLQIHLVGHWQKFFVKHIKRAHGFLQKTNVALERWTSGRFNEGWSSKDHIPFLSVSCCIELATFLFVVLSMESTENLDDAMFSCDRDGLLPVVRKNALAEKNLDFRPMQVVNVTCIFLPYLNLLHSSYNSLSTWESC